MNKRERIIASVTVIVIIVAGAMLWLPEDLTSGAAFGGGDLDRTRTTFRELRDLMDEGPAIRATYRRVEAQFPERIGNRTPEATFSEELSRLMVEKRGAKPTIKTPKSSEIKDAEDYYFIDLEVTELGPLELMVDLLLEFQRAGLLIKSYELVKTNADRDLVRMNVTVSRLAKIDESRKGSRRGRR